MGDGRQLWTALEPDVDVVLRDGGELTLPTGNESVPARGDGFLAVAAAATAAAIATTLVSTTPFIFPIDAAGATTAIAAAAATIAGVTLDIGLVHGDAVTSSTLLSSPARRRQSNRQQRLQSAIKISAAMGSASSLRTADDTSRGERQELLGTRLELSSERAMLRRLQVELVSAWSSLLPAAATRRAEYLHVQARQVPPVPGSKPPQVGIDLQHFETPGT